jgi:hypothetical protein
MTTCCSCAGSPSTTASPLGNRARQGGPEQADGLLDQHPHTHGSSPAVAAAAKGEDLVDDGLGALAGQPHLPHLPPGPTVLGEAGQRHLGIAEDGAEDVVEVVGDAAGKRADGLQPLRLA